MKLGEKLREQRKRRKIQQIEVATAVGITARTLQTSEKGTSYPKDRSIYTKLEEQNFFSAASELKMPTALFAFKLYNMMHRGHDVRSPVGLDSRFLGKGVGLWC
jgi:transcriptional regulator with XRE-family HTH domain